MSKHNIKILIDKYEDEIENYKIGYELHDIQKLNEVIKQKDNRIIELEIEVDSLKNKFINIKTIDKKSICKKSFKHLDEYLTNISVNNNDKKEHGVFIEKLEDNIDVIDKSRQILQVVIEENDNLRLENKNLEFAASEMKSKINLLNKNYEELIGNYNKLIE